MVTLMADRDNLNVVSSDVSIPDENSPTLDGPGDHTSASDTGPRQSLSLQIDASCQSTAWPLEYPLGQPSIEGGLGDSKVVPRLA